MYRSCVTIYFVFKALFLFFGTDESYRFQVRNWMLHSLMQHEIAAVGTQQLNSIYIQGVIVITVWTSGWRVQYSYYYFIDC